MRNKFKVLLFTGISLFIIYNIFCLPVTLAKTSISDLKSKFPNGTYWNHPNSGNNPDGYSSTPCTHHSNTNCDEYGGCVCNSFSNAIQCHGFALKLGSDYYGSTPRDWSQTKSLSVLKAGDIVRYYGDVYPHSIWVYKVNGDTITYADCNSDGQCIIHWGKTTTKSYLSGRLDYVLVAPYEAVADDRHTAPSISMTKGKTYITWEKDNNAISYNVRITDRNGVSYDIWEVIDTTVQTVIPIQNYTVYIDYIYADSYKSGKSADFYVGETYNGPATSNLYANTSGNSVIFSWDKANNATAYNIRISDISGNDYTLWSQTNTYAEKVLPLGTYYAYVDSYNDTDVTMGKKIKFVVTQSYMDIGRATPAISTEGGKLTLVWNKTKNATFYNVRISDSNNNTYDFWNVIDENLQTVLPIGSYTVYIDSANEYGYIASPKIPFSITQVYNGPTESNISADIDKNGVRLTWSKSNNATGYNIRISDDNGNDYSLWNRTTTSTIISLPIGNYYAYVDSFNSTEVTKGQKIRFTVSQEINNPPHTELNFIENTSKIKVDFYNVDIGNNVYLALYDKNDILLDVRKELYSGISLEFNIDCDYYKAKVMVWNDNMKPLCKSTSKTK